MFYDTHLDDLGIPCLCFDVCLMFISTSDYDYLQHITKRLSVSIRINKPLHKIAENHIYVLSAFVINRSWVRVPSLAPSKICTVDTMSTVHFS